MNWCRRRARKEAVMGTGGGRELQTSAGGGGTGHGRTTRSMDGLVRGGS